MAKKTITATTTTAAAAGAANEATNRKRRAKPGKAALRLYRAYRKSAKRHLPITTVRNVLKAAIKEAAARLPEDERPTHVSHAALVLAGDAVEFFVTRAVHAAVRVCSVSNRQTLTNDVMRVAQGLQ